MRTAPVNFSTPAASPKLIVIKAGEGLELIDDSGLVDVHQRSITLEAAGKGVGPVGKRKAPDDLDGLLGRIMRSRAIPISNDRVHEEKAIAREEGAFVPLHDLE